MDLQEIRGKLDQIDRQFVELLEERLDLCGQVAADKIKTGKAVFDKEREQQKLASVRAMAGNEFNARAAEELFTQLMTISRRLQYQIIEEHGKKIETGFTMVDSLKKDQIKVVYQGVEGAYSHAAAMQYFGDDVDAYHVKTWEDAMDDVESGKADYAVIPIENSSAGAVVDNYDLLIKHHNVIVAETCVAVDHALLGLPKAELTDVERVYSHPQALMQSSDFLNQHDWQQLSMENNAVAAQKVRDEKDPSQAAVAGEVAGEIYGLKKLAGPINNCPDNTTRFLILAKDRVYQAGAEKISLCFELPHRSGTLYSMLGNFIFNDVNMRMIESRPIPEESWQYRFFVDIEGNLEDAGVQNALYGIMREAKNVKILGNY